MLRMSREPSDAMGPPAFIETGRYEGQSGELRGVVCLLQARAKQRIRAGDYSEPGYEFNRRSCNEINNLYYV